MILTNVEHMVSLRDVADFTRKGKTLYIHVYFWPGVPASAPDHPATVIAVEFETEPTQDMENIRKNRPRRQVGV